MTARNIDENADKTLDKAASEEVRQRVGVRRPGERARVEPVPRENDEKPSSTEK